METDAVSARSVCAILLVAAGMDEGPAQCTAWALVTVEEFGVPVPAGFSLS